MLNKNGKAVLAIVNGYQVAAAQLKETDGTEAIWGQYSSNNRGIGNLRSYFELFVGTGTTEATLDDYCLEAEDSDLTVISKDGTNVSRTAYYTDNYIASFSGTFKNNTEEDITIAEIGIIGHDLAEPTNHSVLIAREVISPVTIAPNQTYTFSMTIG